MHTPLSCEVAPLWICSHCILRWGMMGQWKWPSSRRNYVYIELRWEVVRGHGKSSGLLLHHSPIPYPYSATFSSQSEITLLNVLYFYWLSPLVEYKCLIKYELTLTWLHLQQSCFQIRSHSHRYLNRGLGLQHVFGGDTMKPIIPTYFSKLEIEKASLKSLLSPLLSSPSSSGFYERRLACSPLCLSSSSLHGPSHHCCLDALLFQRSDGPTA